MVTLGSEVSLQSLGRRAVRANDAGELQLLSPHAKRVGCQDVVDAASSCCVGLSRCGRRGFVRSTPCGFAARRRGHWRGRRRGWSGRCGARTRGRRSGRCRRRCSRQCRRRCAVRWTGSVHATATALEEAALRMKRCDAQECREGEERQRDSQFLPTGNHVAPPICPAVPRRRAAAAQTRATGPCESDPRA